MCDNIVMFGPTHSGKSTLMGYLLVYDLSDEEYRRRNRRIRAKIEEIGSRYKDDRALAYYVDTGKDERRAYDREEKSKGSSKRIHIQKTALDIELDCTFIDTPGTDVAWAHKYQGLFLGDVGIFIIEIGKLLELSRKIEGSNTYNTMINQLFAPVYLWKHYKRMRRLIVAISKIDLASYNQYSIKRAERVLRSLDIFREVPIVPISINVEKRNGNNIVNSIHEEMAWYNGKTLIDEIKIMLDKERDENLEEPMLFAHIERLFVRTKSNNQSALRVKILNGTVRIGDEVYLAPVNVNNYTKSIKGVVASLKHETRGNVNSLTKGEIGGIIFSKVMDGRERIKLSDVELKRTSIIFDNDSDCRCGNLLYFNISKENLSVLDKAQIHFCVGDRIKMIWFGKIICMHLLNIIEDEMDYKIVLMNTSSQHSLFMLPIRKNGKFFYDEYVLQLGDILFINAVLSDLELVSENHKKEVLYAFQGEMPKEKEEKLQNLNLKVEISYDEERKETSIYWKDLMELEMKKSMETTVKILKKLGIESYKVSILPIKNKMI